MNFTKFFLDARRINEIVLKNCSITANTAYLQEKFKFSFWDSMIIQAAVQGQASSAKKDFFSSGSKGLSHY